MKSIITEEQRQEWIRRYLNGETARSISKDYPIGEDAVSRYIKKMGFSRGRGKSKEMIELKSIILQEYCTDKYATFTSLGKKYNISDRTISKWAKEKGIKPKQISGALTHCNEIYFEIIDTPNKAYLLGFITADGAVTGKKGQNPSSCSIEVHEKDKALLDFAKSEINPYSTITLCNYDNKHNVRVSFASVKLVKSLEKYGIIQNKSKIIKEVPYGLIPKELLKYYFRGLIDGDGCINQKGYVSIYSGSEDFIKSVQDIMVKEVGVKKLKIYQGTTYFITWASLEDRKKLFEYLYGDLNATFYYKRKYERLYNSLYGNTEITN